MSLPNQQFYPVFTAKATTWVAWPFLTWGFKHIILWLATSWNTTATIKVYWSDDLNSPDFTAWATSTNMYKTLQTVDLNNWAPTDWNVWVDYTWTDWVYEIEVNTNSMQYIAIAITAWTQWAITAHLMLANNA